MFGYEKREPYPVYISKEKSNDMLNLLFITKEKEKHYVLIKNLTSLCTTKQTQTKKTFVYVLFAVFPL